jgi:hypothetical protein
MDKLTVTVTLDVQGKEGLNLTLTYKDTDMPTVIMVEQALLQAMSGLLAQQAKG